jgi:glycosyltransferase involved in cell wall biosynthesis
VCLTILLFLKAIPTRDVAVIPHGGPNLPYDRLDGTDQQSFFAGKKVILSNGLIHPMKGLELMIWAMKQVSDSLVWYL